MKRLSNKLPYKDFMDYFLLKLITMKSLLIQMYNEKPSKLIKITIKEEDEQRKHKLEN